jgi:hypothetical protein
LIATGSGSSGPFTISVSQVLAGKNRSIRRELVPPEFGAVQGERLRRALEGVHEASNSSSLAYSNPSRVVCAFVMDKRQPHNAPIYTFFPGNFISIEFDSLEKQD